LLQGGRYGWPAQAYTLGARACEARPDALLDDRPLEFREHPHHLEHGLPRGRGGVDALLAQEQVDFERVQFGQEGDEVLQAATEAVDAPGHDYVEFPSRRRPEQRVEGRSLVSPLGARDPVVAVDLHYLVAHATGDLQELSLLVGGRLLLRRHAEVQDRPGHDTDSS
jgi:hypothetical protein